MAKRQVVHIAERETEQAGNGIIFKGISLRTTARRMVGVMVEFNTDESLMRLIHAMQNVAKVLARQHNRKFWEILTAAGLHEKGAKK